MVDDLDATMFKAEKAGGKVAIPVGDEFYGYRSGRFKDPFGHIWIISKIVEELSPEEMQRRMDEMTKSTKPS